MIDNLVLANLPNGFRVQTYVKGRKFSEYIDITAKRKGKDFVIIADSIGRVSGDITYVLLKKRFETPEKLANEVYRLAKHEFDLAFASNKSTSISTGYATRVTKKDEADRSALVKAIDKLFN